MTTQETREPASPVEAWRSIETAPKDGTVFIGWSDHNDPLSQPMKWQAYSEEDAAETGQPGYWAYAEQLVADVAGEADPTHWMPLPQPPSGLSLIKAEEKR